MAASRAWSLPWLLWLLWVTCYTSLRLSCPTTTTDVRLCAEGLRRRLLFLCWVRLHRDSIWGDNIASIVRKLIWWQVSIVLSILLAYSPLLLLLWLLCFWLRHYFYMLHGHHIICSCVCAIVLLVVKYKISILLKIFKFILRIVDFMPHLKSNQVELWVGEVYEF